jgi:hypothetical protein
MLEQAFHDQYRPALPLGADTVGADEPVLNPVVWADFRRSLIVLNNDSCAGRGGRPTNEG